MATRMLTVKEFAELKGIHQQTTYRYIRLGWLKVERIGGAIRIAATATVSDPRKMPFITPKPGNDDRWYFEK